MLASVFSRLKSSHPSPKPLPDRVAFPNPEKNGRLALSAAAMKQIAKRLEFDRPLQVFMTGLRVDAAGMPFDLASEPAKDLTLIGDHGAGVYAMARGFLYQASRAGFRTVQITHETRADFEEAPYEPWHHTAPGSFDFQKSTSHTRARLLNLCGDRPVHHEDLYRALHDAFTDFSTQRIIVSLFSRHQNPEKYDKVMSDLFWALKKYDDLVMGPPSPLPRAWFPLNEVVFSLPGSGIRKPDLDFLRKVSGGIVSVFSYEGAEAWANPEGPCLFGKGLHEATAELGIGEAFLGQWGQEIMPHRMRRILGPYANQAAHVLDPVVERALDRIRAEPWDGDLGHVARLNRVAKACGYRSWHAAQGRG